MYLYLHSVYFWQTYISFLPDSHFVTKRQEGNIGGVLEKVYLNFEKCYKISASSGMLTSVFRVFLFHCDLWRRLEANWTISKRQTWYSYYWVAVALVGVRESQDSGVFPDHFLANDSCLVDASFALSAGLCM